MTARARHGPAGKSLPASSAASVVALTFDDGPTEGPTAAILDTLEARGVRATFFVFGTRRPSARKLIARMNARARMHPHTWADHARTWR